MYHVLHLTTHTLSLQADSLYTSFVFTLRYSWPFQYIIITTRGWGVVCCYHGAHGEGISVDCGNGTADHFSTSSPQPWGWKWCVVTILFIVIFQSELVLSGSPWEYMVSVYREQSFKTCSGRDAAYHCTCSPPEVMLNAVNNRREVAL